MDFFGLFGRRQGTKEIAKSRLQLVLVQDRLNCSSHVMEKIKNDILDVISRYVEIDQDELDIQFKKSYEGGEDGSPMLIANIPVRNMRKI